MLSIALALILGTRDKKEIKPQQLVQIQKIYIFLNKVEFIFLELSFGPIYCIL